MSLTSVWDGSSESRPNPSIFRAPDAADYARIVRELRECQEAVLAIDARFAAEAAEPIKPGKAVRVRTTDGKLKLASNLDTGEVAGIALNDVIAGGIALFVQVGNLESLNWTPATGSPSLQIGQPYYLGTSGQLLTTPVSVGFHVKVGLAISETVLAVKITESIRL